MRSKPYTSVAMTTYNGEKFLRQQLDSILCQTTSIDEIVIVDDCSVDSTLEIIFEYCVTYPHIKVIQNMKNQGVVKSFENALSNTSGDFVFLSDQDDIWFNNKVEVLMGKIGNNLLIHSDAELVDANNNIICESFSSNYKNLNLNSFCDFLMGNIVTGCCVMVKRELLDIALPFPDGLFMHDQYLAQVASYYKKLKYTNHKLVKYRQHNSNVLGANIKLNNRFVTDVEYYKNQLLQLNAISMKPIFKANKNIEHAIHYFNLFLFVKVVPLSLFLWFFQKFGFKRFIGFLIRIFYNLPQMTKVIR